MALSAARGVTQVMNRCEDAKTSGYLDLSDCMLMYIADAIYLVLKGYEINKIVILIINAEGNEIEEIPPELSNWNQIKAMNLSKNKISTIPECIYEMKSLTVLDMSENNIEDFDITRLISDLPKLKQLNLCGNPVACSKKEEILRYTKSELSILLE